MVMWSQASVLLGLLSLAGVVISSQSRFDESPHARNVTANGVPTDILNSTGVKWLTANLFATCSGQYFDLTQEKILYFIKNRNVAHTRTPYGTGKEMQCERSSKCSLYAPDSATCKNDGVSGSTVRWTCTATIYSTDRSLKMTDIRVGCESKYINSGDMCMLRDSCMLVYSLSSWSFPTGGIVAIVFGIFAVIAIGFCLCRRYNQRRNDVLTNTSVRGSSYASGGSGTIPRPYQPPAQFRTAPAPGYPPVMTYPATNASAGNMPLGYQAPMGPGQQDYPAYNPGFIEPDTPPPAYTSLPFPDQQPPHVANH